MLCVAVCHAKGRTQNTDMLNEMDVWKNKSKENEMGKIILHNEDLQFTQTTMYIKPSIQ
jgi:hypothetical protein